MTGAQTQPAYRMYTWSRIGHSTSYMSSQMFTRIHAIRLNWIDHTKTIRYMASEHFILVRYVAWIIVAGLIIAAYLQYIPALILTFLFIIIHTLLFSLWMVLAWLGIGILRVTTALYRHAHQMTYHCPSCYQDMPLPNHQCPTCGIEHSLLYPSIYGILFHRCNSCQTRIPTLDRLGRAKLLRSCPHCHHPFNSAIGHGTTIHISLLGGPSAGKTSFLLSALAELEKSYSQQPRHSITFPETTQAQFVESQWRSLQQGKAPGKTTTHLPQAYTINVSARKHIPALLYIYDAAGTVHTAHEQMKAQTYHRTSTAFILCIDPCTIPAFTQTHQSTLKQAGIMIDAPIQNIEFTYENIIQGLETHLGLSTRKRYPQPLAVVLTRLDLLQRTEPPETKATRNQTRQAGTDETQDARVRKFLSAYGLDNMVRDLDFHFEKIQYFSCSALGYQPTAKNHRASVPVAVLDPLVWLLSQIKGSQVRASKIFSTRIATSKDSDPHFP